MKWEVGRNEMGNKTYESKSVIEQTTVCKSNWLHHFWGFQTDSHPRLVMEEVAYSLVSSLEDASKCEQILQDY